jgi:thioesterase domain-containing protein/acyl carrier protein
MVPSAFVTLEQLPLTPNGKINRQALPQPSQIVSELSGALVAPRNMLELQLIQIWEDILDVRPLGIKDNFFDLGGHSMLAMRLMTRIEKSFGYKLPLASLFQGATVENLAGLLSQDTGTPSWSTLVPIQPLGSRRPFFCIHPAGGDVLCYYHLARHLGQDQPFYGLQAPNLIEIAQHGDNYTRIEDRAAHYIEEMRGVQPEGPYMMGGWSLGGVIAFEMAQQLRRQNQEVALLAMFDSVPPVIIVGTDPADTLAVLAREMASQAGKVLALSSDDLAGLDPVDQYSYVLEQLKIAEVVSPDTDHSAAVLRISHLLKGFNIRIDAYQSYAPQLYHGLITLFKANINPGHLKDEALREMVAVMRDPTHRWGEFAAQAVKTIAVAGYHETMLSEPDVCVLAERLSECIQNTKVD